MVVFSCYYGPNLLLNLGKWVDSLTHFVREFPDRGKIKEAIPCTGMASFKMLFSISSC
jgi:hypothetical protein